MASERAMKIGRRVRAGSAQVNLTVPVEVADLLSALAHSPKGRSAVVAKLVYQHVARLEATAERQRTQEEMTGKTD